jgi:hypothetical protein
LRIPGQIKWWSFGFAQDKLDGKKEKQIMGSQPRKEGNTSTGGSKS